MGSTSQELGVATGLQKHKIQNTGFQQICFKTANLCDDRSVADLRGDLEDQRVNG